MTHLEAYVAGITHESPDFAPGRGIVIGMAICLPLWAIGLTWWLA